MGFNGVAAKAVKILFRIILISIILVAVLIPLEKNNFFNVEVIEVVIKNQNEQPKYLQPLVKELNETLDVYRGHSLWRLDLVELSKNLNKLPWISDVSVMRMWPRKLKITVAAKEVRYLLLTNNGKFLPVVSEGELLNEVETKQMPDVAILRGQIFEKNTALRKKAVQIIDDIPKEGSFSRKTISEVHYDNENGFWFTLMKDALKVKMGQDQMAMKSARVSQVIDYLDSRKLNARVIDANLSKKVLVRLRKGP